MAVEALIQGKKEPGCYSADEDLLRNPPNINPGDKMNTDLLI
ncbi:hypothetical protein [Ralstonia solanacearum]|nr:hypothetical protein [Ralstonia solanacearum]